MPNYEFFQLCDWKSLLIYVFTEVSFSILPITQWYQARTELYSATSSLTFNFLLQETFILVHMHLFWNETILWGGNKVKYVTSESRQLPWYPDKVITNGLDILFKVVSSRKDQQIPVLNLRTPLGPICVLASPKRYFVGGCVCLCESSSVCVQGAGWWVCKVQHCPRTLQTHRAESIVLNLVHTLRNSHRAFFGLARTLHGDQRSSGAKHKNE